MVLAGANVRAEGEGLAADGRNLGGQVLAEGVG